MISVQVGTPAEQFYVPIQLLRDQSTMFKDIFTKHGATLPPVRLSTARPGTFRAFLDWASTGKLEFDKGPYHCPNCGLKCVHPENREKWREFQEPIDANTRERCQEILARTGVRLPFIELFAFALRYKIDRLRRDIVNSAWCHYRTTRAPYLADVVFAAQSLPHSSQLLRLIVDAADTRRAREQAFTCELEVKMAQMLPTYVLMYLWGHQGREGGALKKLCAYHEHAQDLGSMARCLLTERHPMKIKKRKRLDD